MKMKYMLLTVPVLLSYGSLTFAATKSLDHDDSSLLIEKSEQQDHESKDDDDSHEFKDQINALLKSHPDNQNVFVKLCKKDKGDHHHSEHHGHDDHEHDHDNGHDDHSGGGQSAVPVPAAVWLFGSSLIGFLRFKRKTV
ncbi:MAG: hypothetical protein IPN42_15550 [Methylococcaceae bacterium]|nr:hypothetical protein [Methylococcaceae bacterium]